MISARPQVPPELQEKIIDALASIDDDKFSSTKSFSLVCRGLLPTCRKNIFASVALNHDRSEESPPGPSSLKFEWLLSENPSIVEYIRHLDYSITESDMLSSSFPSCLKAISSLRSLSLRNDYSWDSSTDADWMDRDMDKLRPALQHLFRLPTLTSLNLHDGVFNLPISELARCSNLKTLRLGYGDIVDDAFLPTLSNFLPLQLEEFGKELVRAEACCVGTRTILRSRFPDGTPVVSLSSLHKLSMHIRSPDEGIEEEFDTLREFLERAENVRYVRVYVGHGDVSMGRVVNILSRRIETLKHLVLHFNVESGSDQLRGICSGFEDLGRNSIESLTLLPFFQPHSEWVQDDAWDAFDQLLTSSAWSALRKVSVNCRINSWYDGDELQCGLRHIREKQLKRISSNKGIELEWATSVTLV